MGDGGRMISHCFLRGSKMAISKLMVNRSNSSKLPFQDSLRNYFYVETNNGHWTQCSQDIFQKKHDVNQRNLATVSRSIRILKNNFIRH